MRTMGFSVFTMIPREHGAWVVLLVPMGIAFAMEGGAWENLLLLVVSSVAMFLASVPAQILSRRGRGRSEEALRAGWYWLIAELAVGCVAAAPLVAKGFWLLGPIGLFAAMMFLFHGSLTSGRPKSLGSDLVAVTGLTVSGPASAYVLTGVLSMNAILVWFLTILFFGSSVFYVHMKIEATRLKSTSLPLWKRFFLGRRVIGSYSLALVIVAFLTVNGVTSELVTAAFAPMAAHMIIGTLRPAGNVRFRRLGFLLLGQSLLFGVLLSHSFTGS